jgi:hypothetical protein
MQTIKPADLIPAVRDLMRQRALGAYYVDSVADVSLEEWVDAVERELAVQQRPPQRAAGGAEHTPGPWTAGRPDRATIVDGVDSKWIYDARDQYVAVASGLIDGPWDEVMANARLIAAAPDMLAALLEARVELRAVQEFDGHARSTAEVLEKIDAALVRAGAASAVTP